MSVNYKILCEVKILHEYYLTDKDGTTIFDKPFQADRLLFLKQRFGFNYPSVNVHLAYEPASVVNTMFKDLSLRVIETYSGFKLFTSVKEQILPGNIRAYKPLQQLADDLPIVIHLRNKDSFLNSLSNSIINRSLPARYYFSNRNLGSAQVSPILSRTIPFRDDALQYEQGELAFDTGDNQVKAFFFEKNGIKNWQPVNGNGYVNSNDLSLLPPKFNYTFSIRDAITDATFVLKDNSNATISTINRTSSTAITKVSLDYTTIVPVTLAGPGGAIPFLHSLEVTGSNGYNKTHPILFGDPGFIQSDTWGLVHLQPRVSDPVFNLVDNDGLLMTRKNPDGSIVPAPVFEIRVKSRFAFWRYVNNQNEKIIDNPSLHPFLDYDAVKGQMETKKMLNVSYTPIEFINLGTTQYLPNPDADNPLSSESERVYTNIRVPESDLFKI